MATVLRSITSGRQCDGRCHGASHPACKCCCEGKLHGKGDKGALDILDEEIRDRIADDPELSAYLGAVRQRRLAPVQLLIDTDGVSQATEFRLMPTKRRKGRLRAQLSLLMEGQAYAATQGIGADSVSGSAGGAEADSEGQEQPE